MHLVINMKARPQRREAGFKAEDAIIWLIAATQDQTPLALLLRPADRIIHYRIRRANLLKGLIRAAQIGIDIRIIVQVQSRSHNLIAPFCQYKAGMLWQLRAILPIQSGHAVAAARKKP